jgi:ABC-2 type transport system ATP-binding protein
LVRDEIARLKSSQRTIVICTHNLFEAETLADMIAIIYKGRILLTGTLEELKHKVLGIPEYEARFSSDWNEEGLNLPSGVTLTEQSASSLRFKVECPLEANPLLMKELMSKRTPLMTFQEVPRSLEQVYLKVMTDAQALYGEALHA